MHIQYLSAFRISSTRSKRNKKPSSIGKITFSASYVHDIENYLNIQMKTHMLHIINSLRKTFTLYHLLSQGPCDFPIHAEFQSTCFLRITFMVLATTSPNPLNAFTIILQFG